MVRLIIRRGWLWCPVQVRRSRLHGRDGRTCSGRTRCQRWISLSKVLLLRLNGRNSLGFRRARLSQCRIPQELKLILKLKTRLVISGNAGRIPTGDRPTTVFGVIFQNDKRGILTNDRISFAETENLSYSCRRFTVPADVRHQLFHLLKCPHAFDLRILVFDVRKFHLHSLADGLPHHIGFDGDRGVSGVFVTSRQSQRCTVEEIRQTLGCHVAGLDAIDCNTNTSGHRTHQFSAESLRLTREIILLRNKRSQPASTFSELLEQRPIHIIADANTEDSSSGRGISDQPKQLSLFGVLGHAVRQQNNIQRTVPVSVFVGCRESRTKSCTAFGSLRIKKFLSRLSRVVADDCHLSKVHLRGVVERDNFEAIVVSEIRHEGIHSVARLCQLAIVAHAP